MEDSKYKVLIKEVRGMREEVGRIDRDMARDREGMEDFRVQLVNLKSEVEQLRHSLVAHADTMKDKVTDALEPAVNEMALLKTEIKKKRMTVIKDKFDLIGWLKVRVLGLRGDKDEKKNS